ncbi:hypothetical protein N0406_03540 [Pseudomonas aeruginosa]|nr:hypothetical protein [Pseudomonas aeruginosa]
MRILLAALLLIASACFGAANDVSVEQRNATNNGWVTRLMASPPTDGVLLYNTTTLLPQWVTLGSGLSISSGVLVPTQADWAALTGPSVVLNKPSLSAVAASGSYNDLSNKPSIPAAQVQTDWSASSGLGVLLNKPSLAAVATSGAYADLTGKPSIPAAQVNTDWAVSSGVAQVLNKPTTLSGYGITDAYPLSGNPSGFVAQAGARSAISLTTTGTSGAATYNSSTGVLNVPNYAPGTGTVTSVAAGAGLSGGTITTSGTISMPNVGTAGTYANVTTDAQGRVTAGTAVSINDAPGRSLVTSTSATGFQVSATRIAQVCYEGSFSTTSTIGGPSSASVFLETADTNSTTPGDWTTKAQQTYSNTITLAIVLNQVQGNNWTICRYIPAGKYVRIRSGSITGTASASINSQQQETLL